MTDSKPQKNLAAVLYGPRDLRMEERPINAPGPHEIQVHILATGICGSDLHYYTKCRMGPRHLDSKNPMVLGHESAGVITQIGTCVSSLFKIGDRVVIEPGQACGKCSLCAQGRYNLCPKMKFSSSLLQGPNDGTLCRYTCFPETLCHLMPSDMSFDEGALIEPLAVAVHSVERTPLKTGSNVIVFGAGPVGLLTAAVALTKGCTGLTMFDIDPSRLDFAKTYLGLNVSTILLPRTKFQDGNETIGWAQEKAIELGYHFDIGEPPFADVVYECTGSTECVMLSMYMTKRGGTVMLIGMGQDKVLIPTDIITTREVDIRGNFRYANVHKESIALVQKGLIHLSPLVSHTFKLEEAADAFKFVESKSGSGIIKIIITDY